MDHRTEDNVDEESRLSLTNDNERHLEFVVNEMQVSRPLRGAPRPGAARPLAPSVVRSPSATVRRPPPGVARPRTPGAVRQASPAAIRQPRPGVARPPTPGTVRQAPPAAIRQPRPGVARPPIPGAVRQAPPDVARPASQGAHPVVDRDSSSEEEEVEDEQARIEEYSFKARAHYLRKVFYALFLHFTLFTVWMAVIYYLPPVQEYIVKQRVPLMLTCLFLAYLIATLVIFPDLTEDSPYKEISLFTTTFILLCAVSFLIANLPYLEVLLAFASTGLTCLLLVILTTQYKVRLKINALIVSVGLLNVLLFASIYAMNLYSTTTSGVILMCAISTLIGVYIAAEAFLVYHAKHPYITTLSNWMTTFYTIYLDPFNITIYTLIWLVETQILRRNYDLDEDEEEEEELT